MTVSEYIARSVSGYESISFWDSLRSTLPLYFLLAFLILFAGIMLTLSVNVKGTKWIILFCVMIAFVGWSGVKLYQYYGLKSPVKRKVFAYRLARAMSAVSLAPEISLNRKGIISANLKNSSQNHGVSLRYSQNLLINAGGIVPGTPIQAPRKTSPRTWFLEIRGTTGLSTGKPVEYDFSARKDDDDPEDGYGVHMYDPKTYAELSPKKDDPNGISRKIRKGIDGTILKGTLVIDNGSFVLRIFDNIKTIRNWRRPTVTYKSFGNGIGLVKNGVQPEQAAFFGLNNILQILTD